MSIAFQNPGDISSRHLNPYARYESSLEVDGVYKSPVVFVQKQANGVIDESCNDFSASEERVKAGGNEAVGDVVMRRNSVISSGSSTNVDVNLPSEVFPPKRFSSGASTVKEGTSLVNFHSRFLNATSSTTLETKDIDDRSTQNDQKGSSGTKMVRDGKRIASDSVFEDGFVNIPLNGFSQMFPHNLHILHRRQLFCDVTVRAHDTNIHAHKVVLAACSPYFYKVLENDEDVSNTTESVSDYHRTIDLGTYVTATGLRFVVQCMYTSTISLSDDTVQDILEASSYLEMQSVVQACLEFMGKWKKDDVTRKRYIGDQRDRRSSESSLTDLNVTTDVKRETTNEETNPADGSAATTSVLTQATSDTKRDAIYQAISRQEPLAKELDSQRFTLKSYNADVPAVASSQSIRSTTSSTHSHCSSSASTAPHANCPTDSDDDVFMKKESSPPAGRRSSDSGLHDSASSTPSTPGSHDAVATAELLRRRQCEFYRQVLANNPYLLNPEAMAAAVAMTSLTSPLRAPGQGRLPLLPMEHQAHLLMNPAWHHIFGHPMHPSLHSNALHRPGHIKAFPGGLQTTQYANFLQQQRIQQQGAIMNLSGSVPKCQTVENKMPEQNSPGKCRSSATSPPYTQMMLSNLLQNTRDLSCAGSLKRSLSVNSGDHQIRGLDKTEIDKFSRSTSAFSPNGEGRSYSAESVNTNCQPKPQKRRRSTNGRAGSPDRPYKCMVCAAEFNRPANLKTHMRIHSGEKPYKCQSCGARFVQVAHLRAHILIHTGEKPYPCKVCGTRFRHLQTLKSHVRIHTGEKPYACEECQVKFRHKSQLRLHLRTKHGINTNTKKTYKQVPGLNNADISAHIKRTQEAVRMHSNRREF